MPENIDHLFSLSARELDDRLTAAVQRIETRSEGRDLSQAEIDAASLELANLRVAIDHRARSDERLAAIDQAVATTPRPESRAAMAHFAEELAAGRPARVSVECRSVTSANAGARGGVAVEQLGRPEWLYTACRIPFTVADHLTVSGPLYAALVAQSATAEAQDKPAMTDPTLASATLAAFAVTQTVSDQVIRFGVGAQAVTDRLAAESVFSVNRAAAEALETAAGAPLVYTESAGHMADYGIATVWAQTGSKPTALLVNPEDYPFLSAKAAVGPGDTVGAEVVRFNGIPLVVNAAITAGVGVVVNGSAFSAHGTDVLLASLPNLTNNTVMLRAETYFALLQHDEGAIVAVDLTEGS